MDLVTEMIRTIFSLTGGFEVKRILEKQVNLCRTYSVDTDKIHDVSCNSAGTCRIGTSSYIVFVRYAIRASAAKEWCFFFDASASARISWLFGESLFFGLITKTKNTGYELRILGIPVFRLLNYLRERKKKRQRTARYLLTNGQTHLYQKIP